MDKPRKRMSYRLMWLSMAALAPIEVVIQLRAHGSPALRALDVLGYAPNLLAAFALPFFFHALLFLSNRDDGRDYGWAQLWREDASIAASTAIAAGGLVLWEFVQVTRPNRTYDPQDLVATVAGALAFLVVVLAGRMLTRRALAGSLRGSNPSVFQ